MCIYELGALEDGELPISVPVVYLPSVFSEFMSLSISPWGTGDPFRPPILLKYRSSRLFILVTICVALFTVRLLFSFLWLLADAGTRISFYMLWYECV